MRRLISFSVFGLLLLQGITANAQSVSFSSQSPQSQDSEIAPSALRISSSLAPIDASQHTRIMRSLAAIRSSLDDAPVGLSKFSSVLDDSAGTGGIEGYVRGRANNRSAWVLAVAASLPGNTTPWQIASVADDGSYQFSFLHPGNYILMAGADGAESQFYDHAQFVEQAIPVDVLPGLSTDRIDFDLDSVGEGSGVISGTVRSKEDGSYLVGAAIHAYTSDSHFGAHTARADSNGFYELSHLPPGNYIVQASAVGHSARYYIDAISATDATQIEVTDSSYVDNVDIDLPRSSSLAGRVTDQDGNPIPRADVVVSERDASADSSFFDRSYWTQTDSSGYYAVSDLQAGTYYMQAQAYTDWFTVFGWYDGADRPEDATPIVLADGQQESSIDVSLNLVVDTGSIAGRVADADGASYAGANLRLETVDAYPYYVYAFTQSDSVGNYQFNDVPIGEYHVVLDFYDDRSGFSMWYDGVFDREQATAVPVIKDETSADIDFNLPSADGVIAGTVLDSNGLPIANASVYASSGNYFYPIDLASGFGYAFAETDENGEYEITGLLDAEYYVNASACSFWQCEQRWWKDAALFSDAETVVVTDGTTTPPEINFVLPIQQGTASMSGVVLRADGQPLQGAVVTASLVPDSSDDSTAWWIELPVVTDSSGAYSFNTLPAGSYVVYASFWSGGDHAIQWYDGVDSRRDATAITLAAGGVVDQIDFELDPRPNHGTVAGTVTFEDGTVAERAYVEVSPHYWDYAASIIDPTPYHAITGADGSFGISHLPTGQYNVNVFAQSGRVPDSTTGVRYVVNVVGGETAFVDVILERVDEGAGSIGGSVVATTGDRLDIGIVVAVVDDDPHRTFSAITEPGGAYKLTGLPPGEYVVWSFAPFHATVYHDGVHDPVDATRVSLHDIDDVDGVDFALDPIYFFADDSTRNASTYVFGRVTDDAGTPLSDATVYALNDAEQVLQSVRTHADGMYEMNGLVATSGVRIKATHAGYSSTFHDGAERFESAADVVLGSGRFEINFALSEGVSTGNESDRRLNADGIVLRGNYPNPFSGETTLAFSLSKSMETSVTIYDALGRVVKSVQRGRLGAGDHQIKWDGTLAGGASVTSGLYFYRIKAESFVQTGSMMLTR